MKKVSIVIPVYNAERYIDDCLKSLIDQTYENVEIILIDDGSKDSSYDICLRYTKKYEFIKLYKKKNGGPSSARNLGIDKSNGDYICFVDSDDSVKANYVEKLVENSADLIISGVTEVYDNNKKDKSMCEIIQKYNNEEIYDKFLEASESDVFNSPFCKLYKKNIIDNHNLKFDESIRMGEDLIFNIHYLKYCKSLIIIPECLYYYNKSAVGSLTKKFEFTRWNTEKVVYHEYKKLYEFYDLYEKNKSQIDCMLLLGAKKTIYILCMSDIKLNDSIKYIKKISNDEEILKVTKYVRPKNKLTKILMLLIKNKASFMTYVLFKLRARIHS